MVKACGDERAKKVKEEECVCVCVGGKNFYIIIFPWYPERLDEVGCSQYSNAPMI